MECGAIPLSADKKVIIFNHIDVLIILFTIIGFLDLLSTFEGITKFLIIPLVE